MRIRTRRQRHAAQGIALEAVEARGDEHHVGRECLRERGYHALPGGQVLHVAHRQRRGHVGGEAQAAARAHLEVRAGLGEEALGEAVDGDEEDAAGVREGV